MASLVTTEGKNDTLTQYFKGATYSAAWFMGLVADSGFSAFAAGDTAAQIGGSNGWSEWVDYNETVRQTVTLGTAAAGSIDNSASQAVFTMNAVGDVNGAFVVSVSTKAGTAGVLYGEGSFSSVQTVAPLDTLTVTVTITQA